MDRLDLLRRGRGAGFRQALASGRAAGDDVLACVLADPRWDRQVEARDEYYAQLLLLLDVDVTAVAQALLRPAGDADGSDVWLPVGVLAQMARRGHAPAAGAIATAIASGPHWSSCFYGLDAAGGEALIARVVETAHVASLLERVEADALADAVGVVAAPWDAWAKGLPALRFVARARPELAARSRRLGGPVDWIAHRLAPDGIERHPPSEWTPGAAKTAVERLDDAEAFLRRQVALPEPERATPRERVRVLRELRQLPPALTLPRARRWFDEPWPLSVAAEYILGQHATADDRSLLEGAAVVALASGNMYRLAAALDGLAKIGSPDSVPVLAAACAEAPYSYARARAMWGLASHPTHPRATDLLIEALWDCEPESRQRACAVAPTRDLAARSRLVQLSRDPYEDPEVRDEARGRLGGAPS